MAKKKPNQNIHKDLFLFGIFVVFVFAFFKMYQFYSAGENYTPLAFEKYIILLLVIIGVIIGWINITKKEVMPLLLALLVILVVRFSNFDALAWNWFDLGVYIDVLLKQLGVLIASAAIVVAIKEFIAVAKSK